MYINTAARYDAWLPQGCSNRTPALLVSAMDRYEYLKGHMYLPTLCRYRKQVQLDTLSSDVGVYFTIHRMGKVCNCN